MIIMPENLTESQQKQFFDDGYIILKDFFSNEELQKIETAFIRTYAIQAIKISESLSATKEAFAPDGTYTPSGSPSQTSIVLVPKSFTS